MWLMRVYFSAPFPSTKIYSFDDFKNHQSCPNPLEIQCNLRTTMLGCETQGKSWRDPEGSQDRKRSRAVQSCHPSSEPDLILLTLILRYPSIDQDRPPEFWISRSVNPDNLRICQSWESRDLSICQSWESRDLSICQSWEKQIRQGLNWWPSELKPNTLPIELSRLERRLDFWDDITWKKFQKKTGLMKPMTSRRSHDLMRPVQMIDRSINGTMMETRKNKSGYNG